MNPKICILFLLLTLILSLSACGSAKAGASGRRLDISATHQKLLQDIAAESKAVAENVKKARDAARTNITATEPKQAVEQYQTSLDQITQYEFLQTSRLQALVGRAQSEALMEKVKSGEIATADSGKFGLWPWPDGTWYLSDQPPAPEQKKAVTPAK